ncbi:MAG: D-aminoacyl-tRNA deacylase [Candidatus Diapherotrites archaeon]|nr:D-aminoacyl-tRNA deacylase [Candidatus Diapherotrites archaeon]
MNCLVVNSSLDIAGKNIVKKMKDNFRGELIEKNFKFLEVSDEIIFAKLGEKELGGIDLVVFASKHKSESGTPTLCCHAIGNFGKAEYGGRGGLLVPTNARVLANYLRGMQRLNEERGLGFEVSIEVTHHGPYLEKPSVFIEVGSTEKEWSNEKAVKIVAETIATQTFSEGENKNSDKIAIGLGGTHYAPDFTKLVLRKNYSLGHICPSHYLQELNEEMLKQMVEKSGAEEVVLDWRGLKSHKQGVFEVCSKSDLPVKRVQDLLKK